MPLAHGLSTVSLSTSTMRVLLLACCWQQPSLFGLQRSQFFILRSLVPCSFSLDFSQPFLRIDVIGLFALFRLCAGSSAIPVMDHSRILFPRRPSLSLASRTVSRSSSPGECTLRITPVRMVGTLSSRVRVRQRCSGYMEIPANARILRIVMTPRRHRGQRLPASLVIYS